LVDPPRQTRYSFPAAIDTLPDGALLFSRRPERRVFFSELSTGFPRSTQSQDTKDLTGGLVDIAADSSYGTRIATILESQIVPHDAQSLETPTMNRCLAHGAQVDAARLLHLIRGFIACGAIFTSIRNIESRDSQRAGTVPASARTRFGSTDGVSPYVRGRTAGIPENPDQWIALRRH